MQEWWVISLLTTFDFFAISVEYLCLIWPGTSTKKGRKMASQLPGNVDCRARMEFSKIVFGWQKNVHGDCFKVDSRCHIQVGWQVIPILNSLTVKVVQLLCWWVSGLMSGMNSLVNIIPCDLETLPLMTCVYNFFCGLSTNFLLQIPLEFHHHPAKILS